MCQQTRIETVLPYYARWMAQFPDFPALAGASEEAVLTAWSGLGYYARARNLHRLAKAIAALPELPRTPQEWEKLPGIGPYTSAAICSIAFGYPAAVVDGNVVRVLSRLQAIDRPLSGSHAGVAAVGPLARDLLDRTDPGTHNQAVMELGALVCTKHRPACLLCPWQGSCVAFARGLQEKLPRLLRRQTEKVTLDRLWVVAGKSILLQRIASDSDRLAQMAELPLLPGLPGTFSLVATRKRSISHQQITERFLRPDEDHPPEAWLKVAPGLFWHPLHRLGEIPLSGPHRRWIRELTGGPELRG